MAYEIHSEEYKGFKITIIQDEDAESPAAWDEFGTIYTRHNRYFAIGEDLNKLDGPEVSEEIRTNGGEVLKVFAYVHSGVRLSTSPFSCPWDSGQCGFVAATKEKIIAEYGDDSEESREKARKLMAAEIETWNDYLAGNIYGYTVEDMNGEEKDSCWGFYGDYEEGALKEARSLADHYAKKLEE